MNYKHLYRLTKKDLLAILKAEYPHLAHSFYKAKKADIIEEFYTRATFG